ncbi:MAG: hypothetical protein IJF44_01695 [Clostridia bacterium]|nr:hypothetical protein [Clostridia bacterium]
MRLRRFLPIFLSLGFFGGIFANSANVKVKAEEDYDYTQYAETYIPETGIALPPSIAFTIRSKTDVAALNTEKTPSVAVIYVDGEGNAVDASGNAIASLDEVVRACNHKIIPAFVMEDGAAMNAVYNYVNTQNLLDFMVFSSKPAIVKSFKTLRPNCQGGIIFKDVRFDENTAAQIKETLCNNEAMIAIIDGQIEKSQVEEIRLHGVSCWATVKATEYDIYTALYNGVTGMLINNFSMPIEIMESFTSPTMLRKAYAAGHRGENTYPENSIEGAKAAYYFGEDYVELDLMRTKDNRLLIMHDSTLNRTTNYSGAQTVSQMTLDEIRQYKLGGMYEIPVLEDFFDFISVREGMKLLVELKTDDTAVVPLLAEMIEAYGVEDKVIVISSFEKRLSDFKALMPHVRIYNTNSFKTIQSACNYAYRNNAIYGPGYTYLDSPDVLTQAAVRGIPTYSWTYKTESTFNEYMFINTSLTTDSASFLKDQVHTLTLKDVEDVYELDKSAEISLSGTVQKRMRVNISKNEFATQNVAVSARFAPKLASAVKPLDSLGTYENNTLSVHKTGYGICLVSYTWKSKMTETTYDVYAKPIKIVHGVDAAAYEKEIPQAKYSEQKEQEKPAETEEGCGSVMPIGVMGATLAAGAIMIKKAGRKDEE